LRIGFSAAWLLTALGQPSGHHMDYSLVQQTGLYDFQGQGYWPEWLDLLNIPTEALPSAVPTVHPFGTLRLTASTGPAADVPVLAMIGNEQAALLGHQCYTAGAAECSHGTASFINVCLGHHIPTSDTLNIYFAWSLPNEQLPITNYQLPTFTQSVQAPIPQSKIQNRQSKIAHTYCLEADTTVSGAAIRWMRDQARFFEIDEEVGPLAASVPDSAGVVFVPAFTGLNVPYNDRTARGTIFGLTLGSSRGHIVRAFLESLGYQMRTIVATIEAETGLRIECLNVGGGIAASDEACQIQADLLGLPLVRPAFTETAARAAALLAGLGHGVWSNLADLPPLPGDQVVFEPKLSTEQRNAGYARWQQAIERVRGWSEL
jgi:glycerol kinase